MYTREAVNSGGPVLELGVGTGRVAIPTARLGIDVVGIDSSEAMLAVARSKLDSLGPDACSVELVAADMRDIDLRDSHGERRKFPLATIPFRGFQALLSVEDQVRALHSIRRHLTPGGKLIFSMFFPDPNLALEAGDVPRHVNDVTDPDTGTDYVLYQQVAYDTHHQVVSIRMIIEELDQDGAVTFGSCTATTSYATRTGGRSTICSGRAGSRSKPSMATSITPSSTRTAKRWSG